MRKQKRLALWMLVLCFVLCLGMQAWAHEVPDLTQPGSITVDLTYDGEAVQGGSLALYRVGDVRENDGNYDFVPAEGYAAFGAFGTELNAELAARLSEYIAAQSIAPDAELQNADGRVEFGELLPGLYFVTQPEAAPGFEALEPFAVSLPMWEDGAYHYHVEAKGKFALEREDPTEPTKPDPDLPITGQLNWPVPVLAASGMGLLLLGWALCRRKRDHA